MNRINLLNNDTSNKIAAGEVVERPCSVVKELVENSIDAQAKNIVINIEEGGQKKIQITDDGVGIHPEDIKIAFLPHSTSKIKIIDDIFSINTLGFRGEALASISSVSKVLLRSRTSESDFGREIYISGGNIEYIKECGCNIGTTIEINDLFFNVPARQKFLKSSQRETALISDIIMRLAIANSNIAFKLYKNGKKAITTYGNGKLLDTLRCVYDKSTYENIISFEKHSDIVSVYGYIGNSEISRKSRNNESIFVNNRYIKNKVIVAAVENAYKSFLTINKFPFFVLFLDIYPEFIDINVHPTKSEIKFKDDRIIFKLVFDAVHEAMKNALKDSFMKDFDPTSNINNDVKEEAPSIVQLPIELKTNEFINDFVIKENKENTGNIDNNAYNMVSLNNKKEEIVNNNKCHDIDNDTTLLNTPKFSSLKIIGQFHNTYILCEDQNELYLIDQHAAHEKILFEKYRSEIKNRNVYSQILITPIIFELSHTDFSNYLDNASVFKNAGFSIELFGENTLSLKEVPIFLGEPNINDLFINILDNLKNMGSGKTVDVKYNKIASLACKAAIKGHDVLSEVEMKTLVETLRYIDEPFTCPHGRPTIIKFSLYEIEKKFKRIQ